MTVYHMNHTFFRELVPKLFPKMENRDYCTIMRKAIESCREKNYKEHSPCLQLEELYKNLECHSLEPRPLHPQKTTNFPVDSNKQYVKYKCNKINL